MQDLYNKSIELAYAMYEPESSLRCQHFTFVYYRDRLITIGQNSKKTHPVNKLNLVYKNYHGDNFIDTKGCCAELAALLKVKKTTNLPFSKLTLINLRINRNRQIDMSRPCLSCQNLLLHFGPKLVLYSNKEGKMEKYV